MALTQWMLAGLALGACWGDAFAEGIYTCTDSKGRKLTADRPIAECMDREQRELNPSGTVRGKLPPSLTAAERAAEEEKARLAAEERLRQTEDRRREKALVMRYPNKAVHDKERATAVSVVDGVAKTAEARATELQAQRKRLEPELDFYRKDPSKYPPQLKRQLEENEQNLAAQKRFLAAQDEERKRIHARFDEELGQLRRLWAQQGTPAQALK